MDPPENSVEAREASMRVQLAGHSSGVAREEAEAGLAVARTELEGHGRGYGIGFGFVKSFGSPRGLDGMRFEFALTDGERVANLHVVVSGTRLATLGKLLGDQPDEEVLAWMLERLYAIVGAIPRSTDRYAALLSQAHPINL